MNQEVQRVYFIMACQVIVYDLPANFIFINLSKYHKLKK